MKKLTGFILLLYAAFYFSSCREIGPPISAAPIDTSSTTQKKMVLMEIETGDQCVNCPGADQIANELADTTYPQQVAIFDLHDGVIEDAPYSFSPRKLVVKDAAAIDALLGGTQQWPNASIDRFIFPGQNPSSYFVNTVASVWPGYVQQRLADTLKVNIFFNGTPTFNPVTRQLSVSISVKYLYNVTTPNNLNVAITESGIVDPQLTPSGIDTFYVHNNVLDTLLTPVTGAAITSTLNAGYTTSPVTYSCVLPALWNAANCNIVAFVTNLSGSDIEVLQAQEVRVY